MDFQTAFYAASFGNLTRLKNILLKKSQSEIKRIVSGITDGTTPLITACRNEHLDIVLYLLESGADVKQVGTFEDYERNLMIEEVTPLWVAAHYGLLNIVKALIKFHARVKGDTNKGIWLSPMSATFLYGGHLQTMQFLVEQGADVNEKYNHGQTLLHLCAQMNNIRVSKILLKYGAKFYKNDSGVSPLLLAASRGKKKIAHWYIEKLKLPELEIIHAIELLGANKIDSENDPITGFDYWQKSTILRCQDDERPIPKQLTTNSPIGKEFCTLDQLNDLFLDLDAMRIQALLVRERILGICHEDTIKHILKTGQFFADQGNFQLGNRLWIYALERLQMKQRDSHRCKISDVLKDFLKRFYTMIFNNIDVLFRDVMQVFKMSVTEIKILAKKEDSLDKCSSCLMILSVPLHLIGIMCNLKKTEFEKDELMKSVCELLKINTKHVSVISLLHLACSGFLLSDEKLSNSEYLFPTLSVVNLLLELKACPNLKNIYGFTPLHYAAESRPCNYKVVTLLLQHGAHLDVPNFKNVTPLQLFKNSPDFDLCPLRYINLKCLCSQVINTHRIPYTGQVPETLKTFVDMHCAKEFE